MDHFQQETNYTCGCAAARMVLSNFIEDIPTEKELMNELETNDKIGTLPENIISYFTKKGYDVIEKNNSSLAEVQSYFEKGWAIILTISVDVPHYVVYAGHNGNHIKLLDPWYGVINKDIKKFISDKTQYPNHRWRLVSSEFKKHYPEYNFDELESYKYFIAINLKQQ